MASPMPATVSMDPSLSRSNSNSSTTTDTPTRTVSLSPTTLQGSVWPVTAQRNPSAFLRSARQAYGKALARARMLPAARRSTESMPDATAFFRRPASIPPYVSCAFLNDGDKILAADRAGTVDILQLPEPHRPQQEENTCDPDVLGSVYNVGVHAKPHVPSNYFKLQRLDGGHAFVMGLPSGECRIFATEQLDKGPIVSYCDQTLKPAPVAQFAGSFVTDIWRILPPPRKYQRHDDLTLWKQYRDPTTAMHAVDVLHEIPFWNNVDGAGAGGFSSKVNHAVGAAQWDFRETSARTFLAVHVQLHGDALGLSCIDPRTSSTANSTGTCSSPSRPSHKVCLAHVPTAFAHADTQVVAACFVSDHHVAVASQFAPQASPRSTAPPSPPTSLAEQSVVAIWDLRYFAKPKKTLSFPSHRVYDYDQSTAVASVVLPPGQRVRQLSASRTRPGRLLVTIKNTDGCTEHGLWQDPLRNTALTTVIANGCSEFRKPILAIDDACDVVACYEQGTAVSLYDLSQQPSRYQSVATSTCQSHGLSGRKKKRTYRGEARPDTIPPQRIETTLCDRYGLNTDLSCMAWNPSGTILVGGSCDGDLFVWPGPA
jgi:hypothetical protein